MVSAGAPPRRFDGSIVANAELGLSNVNSGARSGTDPVVSESATVDHGQIAEGGLAKTRAGGIGLKADYPTAELGQAPTVHPLKNAHVNSVTGPIDEAWQQMDFTLAVRCGQVSMIRMTLPDRWEVAPDCSLQLSRLHLAGPATTTRRSSRLN